MPSCACRTDLNPCRARPPARRPWSVSVRSRTVKYDDAVTGLVLVTPGNKVHGAAPHALPVVRHFVRSTKGIASDIAKEGSEEVGYDRVPLHAANSLRNFFRIVDGELPQVTQPL